MEIERFILGPLQTNCYLVYDEGSFEAVVIDPADEGDFISQKIIDLGVDPKFIIATHGHFDHLLAALELKLNFNIPFLIHQADIPLLLKMQDSARFFTGLRVDPPCPVDRFIKEGDEICFGKEKLKVIETPGHTPGSICLFGLQILNQIPKQACPGGRSEFKDRVQDNEKSKVPIVFSGDTLFAGGFGRTDFSYSSSQSLNKSLKEKIFVLPGETCVYPGHREETTISMEKKREIV